MARYKCVDGDILVPFTEAEEKEADALEAANPPPTLAQFKVIKIDKMKSKLSNKYSRYVDKYYQKKARLADSDESYDVPETVVSYAGKLKTVSDKMKTDVDALNSIDDVREYRISWPDTP